MRTKTKVGMNGYNRYDPVLKKPEEIKRMVARQYSVGFSVIS